MHGEVRGELAEVEQPVTIRIMRLEERAGLVFFCLLFLSIVVCVGGTLTFLDKG
jgi:hypothetical protein